MSLNVDVRVGETIKLSGSGSVTIKLKSKSGQLSRLLIDADKTVDIELPQNTSRSVVSGGLTGRK